MPITEILERNAREFGNDVALVEVNPEIRETRRVTWKEYELIEPNPVCHYRREKPGAFSTKRLTALPICFYPVG